MYELSQNIYTETVKIDKINSVIIESNIDSLTDTCEIIIPGKYAIIKGKELYYYGKEAQDKQLKVLIGDKINVELGYDNNLNKVFIGYVVSFKKQDNNIILFCEDEMYKLKKAQRVQKSYQSKTLEDIIKDIYSLGDNYITEFTFGKFRIANPLNPSEILSIIKDHYGFYIFFREDKLYAGLKYPLESDYSKEFAFGYPYTNINNPIIDTSNLTKQYIDESQIKVVVNSIQETNEIITRHGLIINGKIDSNNFKDGEGEKKDDTYEYEERDLNKKDIDEYITNYLQKLKQTGYKGYFTTFGKPYIRIGDKINLTMQTTLTQDINTYFVDKVITEFSEGGFRQNITLGSIA